MTIQRSPKVRAAESDAQLTADGARPAVGGDDVGGPDPPEFVDGQIGEHQLDVSRLRWTTRRHSCSSSTDTLGKRSTPARSTFSSAG